MFIQSSLRTFSPLGLKPAGLLAVLMLAGPLVTAQDKVNIYQPPSSDPHDVRFPSASSGAVSSMLPNRSEMPATRIDPIRPASVEELKANVRHLRTANTELQAINPRDDASLLNIGRHALEIHYLALYFRSGLGVNRKTDPPSAAAKENSSDDPLQREMTAIDGATSEFIGNPAAQEPRTVDAQLLSEAVAQLNELLSRTTQLEQLAADRMSPKSRKTLAKLHAETNAASPFLQLDLACDLWTTDSFAAGPATVRDNGTTTIDKIKFNIRHHTLNQKETVPLGDCAAHGREQPRDESYSATIRDFDSYEVKGRVVFYQATYRIQFSKGGKIKRAQQPLYLYFVDWSGEGRFELDGGTPPLRSLPDWVK